MVLAHADISVRLNPFPKQKPKEEALGFGQFFTDHMILMDYDATGEEGQKGPFWGAPRVVPYGPLCLDPAATVFHYGQEMFDGLKAFLGGDQQLRLFRPQFHLKRMAEGAEQLCMPDFPQDIVLKAISTLLKVDESWAPSSPGAALYVRPTLIATEPFLGVRTALKFLLFVILSPVGAYYARGLNPLRIWVEHQYVRAAPGGLGAIKAGANYAASLFASHLAKSRGYDQVLWLDAISHRNIEEVGTMNVFFRIADRVITPPLMGTILKGATRDACIEILRSWGVTVEERVLSIDEVIEAHRVGTLQEVFGTGTAAVVVPVGELGFSNRTLKVKNAQVGEWTQRLYDEVTDIQYGRREDTWGWMVPIESKASQEKEMVSLSRENQAGGFTLRCSGLRDSLKEELHQ